MNPAALCASHACALWTFNRDRPNGKIKKFIPQRTQEAQQRLPVKIVTKKSNEALVGGVLLESGPDNFFL